MDLSAPSEAESFSRAESLHGRVVGRDVNGGSLRNSHPSSEGINQIQCYPNWFSNAGVFFFTGLKSQGPPL